MPNAKAMTNIGEKIDLDTLLLGLMMSLTKELLGYPLSSLTA